MDDPFALLGLPRRYDLARQEIESAHLRHLARLHPDLIADPLRRAEADRELARLNEARDALLNDERRADLLLGLLGGPAKEEERSLPEGFLEQMLEVREEMEEAVASGDPQRRAEMVAWAAERRAAHRAAVAALFAEIAGAGAAGEGAALDDATADPGASAEHAARLRRVRLELNAWRYIERMIEQLG